MGGVAEGLAMGDHGAQPLYFTSVTIPVSTSWRKPRATASGLIQDQCHAVGFSHVKQVV